MALAWGVLRGATEAATEVVIRIDADPGMFASLAVVGGDPFTKGERPILPLDVHRRRHRHSRAARALRGFPAHRGSPVRVRTSGSRTLSPALVVFYLGVPDTAPEFPSASALESYLVARIAQARQGAGSKRP